MAGVSTAEISEYEDIGFIVLKKRIDPILVRSARDAVAKRAGEARKTMANDKIHVSIYGAKSWPSECQILFEAVEINSLIGVYQSNKIEGRGPREAVFFTIPLDENVLESGVNMPGYYKRSYIDGIATDQAREGLKLEEGDVLVSNGGTGMKNEGEGGTVFMLIKHFWA
ncbi:hypothetical protein FGG08_003141 [Glutinoglossum americanum]|uniref:Uncharacterized protein n=1 Tax=Glutinoglossum americanum TaxID=1670608 RepID=A0A9P8I7U8_9PEZI|nr:hypothetical protein FGG08_003141 [Glutinoglossum americanum]